MILLDHTTIMVKSVDSIQCDVGVQTPRNEHVICPILYSASRVWRVTRNSPARDERRLMSCPEVGRLGEVSWTFRWILVLVF